MDLNMRILVAEDESSAQILMRKYLNKIGFKDIVLAANGKEAWHEMQAGSFGLILSDWDMPEMTGLDLLKKARASAEHRQTPFLLITALKEKEKVVQAIKHGANNYVVKPLDVETLKRKIEETLERAKAAAPAPEKTPQ